MSFFKRIFSKPEQLRSLSSPKQLKINDIIVLSDNFALPAALRTKQFQVSAINSYEYESNTQTEWVLSGDNDIEIFLTLDIDDKTYLKFSLKISSAIVESLFDLDDFATIFEPPGEAFIERINEHSETANWSSEQYQQDSFATVGYFHRKDHRSEQLSAYQGKESGEQFELYVLHDADQSRGIEVEVWSDGDTDVFLTIYRPLSDIIDMYPGS
jgi:hypothetical protein